MSTGIPEVDRIVEFISQMGGGDEHVEPTAEDRGKEGSYY